jgi:hypothetical protein
MIGSPSKVKPSARLKRLRWRWPKLESGVFGRSPAADALRAIKDLPDPKAFVTVRTKVPDDAWRDLYGRSPAMEALPHLRAWNDLPVAERVKASSALMREELQCPECERRKRLARERARRFRAKRQEKRWQDELDADVAAALRGRTDRVVRVKAPRRPKRKGGK